LPASHGLDVEITDVNGWPALVGRRDGAVTFVINIETDGAKIATIRSVTNPQKLHLCHVSRGKGGRHAASQAWAQLTHRTRCVAIRT
jgi:hypothetical protein